uniref:Histidinol dehydrogenase n=1 Tax=Desulfomonile tiedjei TaxID=2358 RepID=A0A7C4AR59_9BACT
MNIRFFALSEMDTALRQRLCQRTAVDLSHLVSLVEPMVQRVRSEGDKAVSELTREYDGADIPPGRFRVHPEAIEAALHALSPELRQALEISIANIKRFHEKQREQGSWQTHVAPGILAGEKVVPIPSAGLYIPRGKGSFPSMMMMAGVPAKVAGVERVVVVTPPDADGAADRATLAAASLIGVDEIYCVGGVQAIAALAFGTETIPKVAKIVGPGSGYVMAAKQLVSPYVDTGLPAGPSEAIILADDTVDPETAATDLLIEAEHGSDSSAFLLTTSATMAQAALQLIPSLASKLPEPRRTFCRHVLENSGGVLLAQDMHEAIDFINEFAPEHLQILTRDPLSVLDHVKCAGEALLGYFTPGTLANYSLGPNAILPTSGFARTWSSLSVRDFTRRMSFAMVDEKAFRDLAPHTAMLAHYEGFPAHAAALTLRLQRLSEDSSSHSE